MYFAIETEVNRICIANMVKDNGLGMSCEDQEKLYTMFKRFHNHVDGSGIGLYIVKRIFENAGGRIEVVSAADAGSEFKVYFKD